MRRSILVVAAGMIFAGLLPGAMAVAALPVANMEAIVKAAQIDPRRADTALTPGARDSVLLVERALNARGLLASQYIDGHFGTRTIDAYAAYQRSLGFSGLDATGLPGRTSLQLLGDGRYTLVRLLSPGSRTVYHDATMNTRTKAMLVE